MAPPHLTANAPILNVLEPLGVDFFPMRREEPNQLISHYHQGFIGFWVAQKPLLTEPRLDRDVASIAEANIVFVRFSLGEQSPLLQQLGGLLTSLEPIKIVQLRNGRAIDPSVRVQNVDYRQAV